MARKRTSDDTIERAVIGACLRYKEEFEIVAKIIRKPEIFRLYSHRVAWAGLLTMAKDGLPFEPTTLYDVLVKRKQDGDCRVEYLVELWEQAPSVSVAHHARTLLDLFIRRELLEETTRCQEEFADPAVSPLVTAAGMKTRVEAVTSLLFDEAASDDDGPRKWIPFPIEMLPGVMQDYCLAGAEALHCDPAFLAIPALVTAAGAIGTSRNIQIKQSWSEPAVLWGGVVADSSTMKSPSMDMAVSPLYSLQRKQMKLYEFERERWKSDIEDWKRSSFEATRSKSSCELPSKPTEPKAKKIVVSDITIEKLAHVLWENPQGVVLLMDELAGWFGSFGRYSDGAGPSREMSYWLSMYGARSMIVDRKGGDPPSIYVPSAAVSVYGTIQPKILKRILTDDYFDSGMASRLLFALPPKKPKVWTEAIIPQVTFDAYHETITEIYDSGSDWLSANNNAPKPLFFTTAGKSAWIEFYEEWSDRQNHADGEFAYALAKLEGLCARLALVVTVFEKASVSSRREEVTEGQVKRVFELIKWFAHETERIYKMLREPEQKSQDDRLIDFIRAHEGEMTPSRLRKANPSRYENVDDAEAVLNRLVEKGLGKFTIIESGPKGGRPARKFVLAPS